MMITKYKNQILRNFVWVVTFNLLTITVGIGINFLLPIQLSVLDYALWKEYLLIFTFAGFLNLNLIWCSFSFMERRRDWTINLLLDIGLVWVLGRSIFRITTWIDIMEHWIPPPWYCYLIQSTLFSCWILVEPDR